MYEESQSRCVSIRETFNKLDNAKTGAEHNNENDTE